MEASKMNVVGLHTGTVYEDIQTFLNKLEIKSKNTKINYERSIRQFFVWYRGKELAELTEDDLKIRNADALKYQQHLANDYDYANSTINNNMAALASLYDFLKRNDYDINPKSIVVDSLEENSERAGELLLHEPEEMAQRVLKQVKGVEKSALIRLAYTTGFRKSSILNLSWDDITKNPAADHYLISAIVKGNKRLVLPISKSLYNELLKIKEQEYYSQYTDNKVFHLTEKTIHRMLEQLKEEMGIPAHRNIVFHSFRGFPSQFGTLEELQDLLGHSDINTTKKHYRNKNKDYSNMISLRMEEKIDDSIFEGLNKEELINMILSQNDSIKMVLKKEAKKITEKNSINKEL